MNYSIFLILLFFADKCIAQVDTIYTDTDKIACMVRVVTSDSIKFSLLNEEHLISFHKKNVQKIVYLSSHTELISEPINYNKVVGADDWDNVSITRSAKAVRGFRQVGTISADVQSAVSIGPGPALVGAIVNNTGMVKKRFFRKIKMQCAMLGGNLIHITQSDSTSALYLGLANKSAEMTGAGVAYATEALDAKAFRTKLTGKTSFICLEKREMSSKDFTFSTKKLDSVFKLNYIISETGLTYAIGTLSNVDGNQFRVTNFTDRYFTLMYKVKSTIYNYVINF